MHLLIIGFAEALRLMVLYIIFSFELDKKVVRTNAVIYTSVFFISRALGTFILGEATVIAEISGFRGLSSFTSIRAVDLLISTALAYAVIFYMLKWRLFQQENKGRLSTLLFFTVLILCLLIQIL